MNMPQSFKKAWEQVTLLTLLTLVATPLMLWSLVLFMVDLQVTKLQRLLASRPLGRLFSYWVWSGTFLNLTQMLGYYTLNLSQRLANS